MAMVELAIRQNNMNSLVQKKIVSDSIKLCMALLKQKEKEIIEEMKRRRCENEQALILQQVELAIRQNNMNSLVQMKNVTDSIKRCMALLKQKEIIEEMKWRRCENEQALILQQEIFEDSQPLAILTSTSTSSRTCNKVIAAMRSAYAIHQIQGCRL